MIPQQLTCEHQPDPLGIDTPNPRLSWKLSSERRGEVQTSYRILVASSRELIDRDKGDKWDSGTVNSDRSINIPYGGEALRSGEQCWWKVCVTDGHGSPSSWSETAHFEMGLLKQEDWKGTWIGAARSVPAPLLRKEFELAGAVKQARLYVSGIGWSEIYLNGKKVSDRVLDPCTSEYGKSVYYVVDDVTDMLNPGANALGIWLGNGWYCEPETWKYGDSPRALVQLDIEYADGKREAIVSDPSWKATGSCITQNDFYFGETYDARLEIPGWSEPGFRDTGWSPAEPKEAPGGALRAQLMPPIRVVQIRKPQRLTEPRPGTYVYHFDQLFGGWVRLRIKGPAGAKVTIKYSARLDKESGLLDTRRHETPRATDHYVLKGDPKGEVYQPRFTYHPVQYVQVEGAPGALTIDSADGCVVHTDEDLSGGFECSNELVNRIHHNVRWTLTNGLFGLPLDCLYREHWAWTDPATITGSLYPRKYMPRFWTKWLLDIADSQGDDGQVPHVCPIYFGQSWDAAWGGNYPQLVWYLYQYYDDERMLEEHYDGMKRVVDYMTSVSENLIIVRGIYGDHMLPGSEPGREEFISSETPRELVWTGYFYRAALAVSQSAGKLGREADARTYAALADDIRTAFNDKWLDAGKHVYATGSQTAQAFPLALDIVPAADRAGVIERMVRSIAEQYDNHHHTGNTGATCLIDVLRDLGHGELLWRVVINRTYPGWGFMVAEGATTIWESWSLSAGCGNAESMIMWATIDEFFYNDLAGIRGPEYYGPATVQPGFKEIRIAPFVPRDLDSARGSIMTAYGMVSASWRKTSDGIMLEVEVPANATARVGVPKLGKTNVVITESGTRIWEDGAYTAGVEGITGAVAEDEFVTFDVGSGSYRFDMTQVP